jgi:hypothetical protein
MESRFNRRQNFATLPERTLPLNARLKPLVTMFYITVALGLWTGAASGQEVEQRFCIVPIKAVGDGPAGETWRLVDTRFDIPGLPAPVFTPSALPGGRPWTISKERKAVPYKGPFPRSYLDQKNWIQEPWSDRLVALSYGGGVSILAPGSNQFEEIAGSAGKSGHRFGAIAVLPRRHLTILVENSGAVFVLNGNTLDPWLSKEALRSHGINGIRELHDSPLLSALIIRDKDGALYALTDDDKWESVGSIGKSASGRFVDTPASDASVFLSKEFVLTIRKNSPGAEAPFVSETFTGHEFYVSNHFGQLIGFRTTLLGSGRWQRLSPEGFVDIPGGDFAPVARDGISLVQDLSTLRGMLLEGTQGLYLYDGARIQPVKGSSHEIYGNHPRIYDLQSIGRVLLVAKRGMFELTNAGELVGRSMPFPTDTYPLTQLVDWPKAGTALAATKFGVFVLDQSLNARPILGGDRLELGWLDFNHGEMFETGELILSGHSGIFLAVDGRGAEASLCRHEREVQQAIPQSTLCLRAVPDIPGRDENSNSPAIGGMIEAPRRQGLLIDTAGGILLLRPDGILANIEPRRGQYARSLRTFPWSEDVFEVGHNSTVVHGDLSLEKLDKPFVPKVVSSAMRVALVDSGENNHRPMLLRLENEKYELLKIDLNDMQKLQAAYDTPWLGGMLTLVNSRLFLLQRDANLVPLVAINTGASPPPISNAFYSDVLFGVSDVFAVSRIEVVYVRSQQAGWFRLTKEREWLPIRGLPNQLALAHFDPGQGEVLFGLSTGVYAVDANGGARKVAGPSSPQDIIRTFADVGHVILAGGNEGLFEIAKDLSRVVPVANGSAETIGSVAEIINVGFAGFDIVQASNGTFAFENGELKRIPSASLANGFENYKVFEGARRVFAMKSGDGPPLFELGRNDQNGRCLKAIVDER